MSSKKAKHYLSEAKKASLQLDGLIPALDEFEGQEVDVLEAIKDNPDLPKPNVYHNRLKTVQGLIEFTQSKVHLQYIKIMTNMEQYRIEKELENETLELED